MRAAVCTETIASLCVYVARMWVSFWLPAPGISIKRHSSFVSLSPDVRASLHSLSPEVLARVNSYGSGKHSCSVEIASRCVISATRYNGPLCELSPRGSMGQSSSLNLSQKCLWGGAKASQWQKYNDKPTMKLSQTPVVIAQNIWRNNVSDKKTSRIQTVAVVCS